MGGRQIPTLRREGVNREATIGKGGFRLGPTARESHIAAHGTTEGT